MIDGMIAGISAELGTAPSIIFTGGLASLFEADFNERGTFDQLLTLEGLRLIHDRVVSA
jgi:type III pantothenate kinase